MKLRVFSAANEIESCYFLASLTLFIIKAKIILKGAVNLFFPSWKCKEIM